MSLLFGLFSSLVACQPAADTSDTGPDGSTTDTADSGDTGDSADTGDTGVEVTPSILWLDSLLSVDLTPDGSVALAQDATSMEGALLLIDTTTGETTEVTTLGDAGLNLATGLSAELDISAYFDVPVLAGRWSQTGGWTEVPSPYASGCDSNIGAGFDVSDDGDVVVGLMWDGCAPAAFRWTESGGTTPLAILGEPVDGSSVAPTNRATVVSGDGQVAAGFAANGYLDRTPARWSADGSGELLAPDEMAETGEVLSIDQDGDTLGVQRGYDGYRWTESGGFVSLGRVDTMMPTDTVYPNALTADGRAVFGGVGSEYFTVPVAFVWTEAAGMRAVQELAVAAGIEIPEGYWLTSVVAASDDGTVLLGRAFDADFSSKTFILHAPAAAWGL